MLWTGVHVAGLGTHLPKPVLTEDAVARGDYAADELAETELVAALVAAEGESAPDMAVSAARDALRGIGSSVRGEVDLVLYAHLYHQGQDFWNPAAYVSRYALPGTPAPGMQIQQSSNGGMAALELAAGQLSAPGGKRHALVVTSDRYALPGFDRWRSDVGQVYSDGATAAVLSTGGGFARLVATCSTTNPALEELTRDTERFSSVAHEHSSTVDLRVLKRRFMERAGADVVFQSLADGVAGNVSAALCEAGLTMDDISRVVLPNVGRELLEWEFLDPLDISVERTTWDWGRGISHLGAGDQVAGLHRLVSTGAVLPGDRVLLVGAGLGFNWTSAIVQIDSLDDCFSDLPH